MLTRREDLEKAEQFLCTRADGGDGDDRQLANVLARQGHGEEAERLRRLGLAPDGSTAIG